MEQVKEATVGCFLKRSGMRSRVFEGDTVIGSNGVCVCVCLSVCLCVTLCVFQLPHNFVFLPLLHNPTQTLSTAQSRFNASCCTTPLYRLIYWSSGDARATFELYLPINRLASNILDKQSHLELLQLSAVCANHGWNHVVLNDVLPLRMTLERQVFYQSRIL